MKKRKKNISLLLNRHQNKMTFTALPLILAAILFAKTGIHTGEVICFLLATVLCGIPIFYRAFTALKFRTISIELLVTIATIGAVFIGEYSECAIVTFLFQAGNYLEGRSLKKTRSAIRELTESAPKKAYRRDGEDIEEIDADEVEKGDILLVREGDKVPTDGTVLSSEGYLDESSITGESGPVHKFINDHLYAGSILVSGNLTMTTEKCFDDTTYAKIIELVEEAQDAKSPVERFIDRFAKYYTPFVIAAAAAVLLFTRNLDTAITVLVLACPGALVIGAPIASVAGIGNGARKGILFKGGDAIHTFAKCDTFLFDKTGTLTYGDTRVASFTSFCDDTDFMLSIALAMEQQSTHPLGKAVVSYAKQMNIEPAVISAAETIKGKGLRAECNGDMLYLGNETFLKENGISFTDEQSLAVQQIHTDGSSIVLLGGTDGLYLCFGISDVIRDGAEDVLKYLGRNCETVMLTGDHQAAAERTAEKLGIRTVRAQLLPDEKYSILTEYQNMGKTVCFTGDGLNDSPSIVKADTGIAMGNGTDVAIEYSDIVILNSDLRMLKEARILAERIVRITNQNIVIATGTVVLLLIGLFAGYIHMSSGMLIHELSIFAVILNGIRLQKK